MVDEKQRKREQAKAQLSREIAAQPPDPVVFPVCGPCHPDTGTLQLSEWMYGSVEQQASYWARIANGMHVSGSVGLNESATLSPPCAALIDHLQQFGYFVSNPSMPQQG